MRRLLIILFALCMVALRVSAQTRSAQSGDPPILSRIEVSPQDRFGQVTVVGTGGAIVPNSYVGVRNLFTGETVYTRAGVAGGFTAQLGGTADTPFWISPASQETPRDQRSLPGSMPGGPGAILYPTIASLTPNTQLITQIALDGNVADWASYANTMLADLDSRTIYALRNQESLYVAIDGTRSITQGNRVQINISIDGSTYAITFDPLANGVATLKRTNPNQRDLGTLPVSAVRSDTVEARIPLNFTPRTDIVQLESIHWLDDSDADRINDSVSTLIPEVNEIDGIVRTHTSISGDAPGFGTGGSSRSSDGTLATWIAQGRANSTAVQPGETWQAELDVTLTNMTLPADAQITTQLIFQPIAQATSGSTVAQPVSGAMTNNGWSDVLTPSGLPIDGQINAVIVGGAVALPNQIVRREDATLYPLDFAVTLPDDLPPGLYVPMLRGVIQSASIAGGETRWDQQNADALTRLPLVVSIGGIHEAHLPFVLFADDSSDGSRGILSADESAFAGLSNRVRFNSPTIILQPYTSTAPRRAIPYAIEPYLPDILPNLIDQTGLPLIPFQFPGGRLSAQVQSPSGKTNDLGVAPFLQNQLSTTEFDERDRFGKTSPVDIFRLTTLEPRFSGYTFDEYGDYVINMTGTVNDVWGNTYTGGGEYHVVVAEPLDLTPGVMPGTPFTVGDLFNPGLVIAPGFSADVTVALHFYPVDGSPAVEQTLTGRANSIGQFSSSEPPLIFSKPGEYVIDYEARYRSVDGSLWAGSLRSAGVVAPASNAPAADNPLEAHGARGTSNPTTISDNTATPIRPSWFELARYADLNQLDASDLLLNFPYHSGDVLWISDGRGGRIEPMMTLQDRIGTYADWLRQANPAGTPSVLTLDQQIDRQEMPVTSDAGYVYISAVRPNVSVRQFVTQGDGGGLPLSWDNDDPLNRQIGAGVDGVLPDDVMFLFGGAVIHPPDGEATTAGYASAAVVIPPDASPGARVFPPGRGRDGGGDGGILLTFNGIDYSSFIVPTGLQAGDVLKVGEKFNFTGQVAPTLPAVVRVTYTKPSGATVTVEGQANAFGYFYSTTGQQTADEAGVWSAVVEVIFTGRTSAGVVAAPGVRGGIIGVADGQFDFYVVPTDAEPLAWNPALTDSLIAIGLPYNFNFTLPVGWTNIHATLEITTPGYVLDTETLRVSGRSFSYQYTAPVLGRTISILETDVRTPGNWVSDNERLTFVATGTDENGNPAIRARTFTLMHDRLVTAS